MTKRIGIHGFYGMQNLGDEALLHVFLQEGRRAVKGFTPVVYSRRPDRVRDEYCIESQPAISGRKRWIFQQWNLWRNQLFILGGGGLLHDYGPDSSRVRIWLSLLRSSLRLHRKTALFFVGVDQIRHDDSRRLIADTVSKVDYISVRDQRSADYLRGIGVKKEIHVSGDPAILLATPKNRELPSDRKPRVGICLRHWFQSKMQTEDDVLFEQILDELAFALDKVSERYDAELIFYPMRDISYDDDREINKSVMSRMMHRDRTQCVEICPSVTQFLKDFEEIDVVLAMRLHAVVLPSAMGIPVIALEYMPKVGQYMRTIGQERFVLPMNVPLADRL